MPIVVPGKRVGKRLEKSKVFGHGGHGKKTTFADLLITPLVDMFVIIVLFLIANFSATGEVLMMSKEITLPDAVNVKELEMVPVVQVTPELVLVDSQQVIRVDDLMREDYLNIPQLEEKLRELKKKFEDLHRETDAFKGDVNIQAHKDMQFKVVKKVMFSCASAGYGNINFAVMTKAGPKPEDAAAAAPAP